MHTMQKTLHDIQQNGRNMPTMPGGKKKMKCALEKNKYQIKSEFTKDTIKTLVPLLIFAGLVIGTVLLFLITPTVIDPGALYIMVLGAMTNTILTATAFTYLAYHALRVIFGTKILKKIE